MPSLHGRVQEIITTDSVLPEKETDELTDRLVDAFLDWLNGDDTWRTPSTDS